MESIVNLTIHAYAGGLLSCNSKALSPTVGKIVEIYSGRVNFSVTFLGCEDVSKKKLSMENLHNGLQMRIFISSWIILRWKCRISKRNWEPWDLGKIGNRSASLSTAKGWMS
jgi:hypothetical protein